MSSKIFASEVSDQAMTVPRKATATVPEERVTTKACAAAKDETTVISRADPSCAQSGQDEHTEAVGHEFSAAASSYASVARSTARSPSVGEKTATVAGL